MADKRVVRRDGTKDETVHSFFATCFQGVETVLAGELRAMGAKSVRPGARGVQFNGTIDTLYKVNLRSRTAHRVLFPIATFDAADRQQLYDGVRAVRWSDHLSPQTTLAVDTVGTNDQLIHTQFTSRVVKDGIVDWFRDNGGTRPSVDLKNPGVRFNARLRGNTCTLSWDTSGERLHRRGYRGDAGGAAPLKENLAAAILILSGYDGTMPFIDPMCGSGTLLVEAALIAQNRAPGLLGRTFALTDHPSFDRRAWDRAQSDARSAVREVDGCPIVGSDISKDAVRAATAAAAGSGTDDIIRVVRRDIGDLPPQTGGMVVTNPPYGERLGDINELAGLYKRLGAILRRNCRGMTAHVMTGSRFLANRIGLSAGRSDVLWNGPIECRLLHYDID